MIESLRIENWVIVEAADLEFGPGLNVLTGETGTGKSIVLGALALLAGGRGSADAVRTGADRAVLEAVFAPAGELTEELSRRELDTDGEGLIVQRTLVPGGRSRVRVAGERVPASTLSELLADQIEISSQHSSQGLLRPEIQGRLVDDSGGLLPLRAEVAASLDSLRSLDADLATLRGESEERARQQDFLAYQLAEIDEVGLVPGEVAELESARARLAHADRIANEGRAACAALVGAEPVDELPNAIDRLSEAIRWVEGLAVLDPALAELTTRLRAQESELFEAARDLERYLQRIDSDPARLGEVEDRLAAIRQLQRKYGNSDREIAESRERIAEDLAAAEGADRAAAVLRRWSRRGRGPPPPETPKSGLPAKSRAGDRWSGGLGPRARRTARTRRGIAYSLQLAARPTCRCARRSSGKLTTLQVSGGERLVPARCPRRATAGEQLGA